MDSFGMEENMCWADMVEAEEQQAPPTVAPQQPPEANDDGWTPVRKVFRRGAASKPIPIVRPKEQAARRVVKHRFQPRE